MNTVLSVALLVLALIPAPRHYYFRYSVRTQGTSLTRAEFVAPLERGLFADSLIVPGDPRHAPVDWSKVDTSSAARENRVTTLLVVVDAARDSSSFRVAVTVKNALAQTLAGPDTLHATQVGLDTALVESGRRLAKRLAQIGRR